jgi:uncharacterized membrane protein
MDTARRNKLAAIELGLLLAAAITLRFANLGYSNLQGDEIKALCYPGHFTSVVKLIAFLLTQRRGPVEFLVTCAVGLIDPSFSSELLLRLPFAFANLLGIACLFGLAWILFNRQTAVYAGFLLAANGLFVAFGRIVQYQSFVILGVSAALLGMTLAVERDRWRVPGLYLGFVAAACALLVHFDAGFVLPPLALLTVHWWLRARHRPDSRRLAWHLAGASALAVVLVGGFYLEYAAHLGSFQVGYWEDRLSGPATDTLRVANYYNPAPFVWFTLAAAGLGLTGIRRNLGWQVLAVWLIPPLLFMEVLFSDSGTHAYTYFLPLLLIAGIGLTRAVRWIQGRFGPWGFRTARTIVLTVLLLNVYASYMLFVDHTPEYPWWPKTVLGTTLPGGHPMNIFGFPYNRAWRAVENWFAPLSGENKVVVTNEKPVIASFYLPSSIRYDFRWSRSPERLPKAKGLYFVVVDHPQSGMDQLWGWTAAEWRANLTPIQTFSDGQERPVAWIYFLTEEQRAEIFR